MKYLTNLGIKEETLDKIIKQNGDAIELSIECNEENITNIILFLKKIGIQNIDYLLIYEFDIFLTDFEIIKSKLMECSNEIIDTINNDFTFIEEIL